MIILINGPTHVGKTKLAQRLLEESKFPYLSIDHLKMGLIRAKYTELTTEDDFSLTFYLWPIIREIIKTAIENNQNLIIEGCYIPFDWQKDFSNTYLTNIKAINICFSTTYLQNHFDLIKKHSNDIEKRLYDDCNLEYLISENNRYKKGYLLYNQPYLEIINDYESEVNIFLKQL